MTFYILGVQPGTTQPVLISRKDFDSIEAAQQYLRTVSPSWRPFIVQKVEQA